MSQAKPAPPPPGYLPAEYPDMEKKDDSANVVVAQENPEYIEFLALQKSFEGAPLKKLTRKIDWHVLPQLIVIYLLSYVDRSNIGNARLFGAEADMRMSGTDWNIVITYALGGPPSNLALKRFGPKIVLPTLLTTVSIILIGSGCANSFPQWIALRLLLGLFEAGMFPGCAYTLTTWYTPEEIHSRTTIFYVGASGAGAFSGLLAFGIGQLDYTWGFRGWRWIYVLEGLLSFVVGISAFFLLQDRPEKQGRWLSDDERRYLVLRNRFMYGGAKYGAKDEFSWHDALEAFKSWHTWVMAFSFFSIGVAVYGLSFTLPTIVANMGFTAATAQALSAPPYIFACLCVLVSGWYSDRYQKRMWAMVIPASVGWIGLLLSILTVSSTNLIPLTYIGVSFAAGGMYCLSPCVAVWIGLNSAGQTKRAAAISITVVFSQFGGLVGSNIYLANEKPKYPTGFGCSLGFLGAGCIVAPIIYWWMIGRINRRRALLSEEEILAKHTEEELTAMGDKSPFYRYER